MLVVLGSLADSPLAGILIGTVAVEIVVSMVAV